MRNKIFYIINRFFQTLAPSKSAPPTQQHDWGLGLHASTPGDKCPFLVAPPSSRFFVSSRVYNTQSNCSAITVGEYSCIRGELTLFAHGGSIVIGDYCYVGEGARIWSAKSIKIGHRVLISHNVNIFDSDTHPIDDYEGRHQQFKDIIATGHPRTLDLREEAVVIEDDVLIACQSVILKGVTIGRGAVVGAGSVVTHDVAPFTLVAGNPARVIRAITPPKRNPARNQEA